ncbi:TadE/TadG family type IV pilus assembly protein [Qipengyuania sp. JC766]|uniref:TadE/TadG family type IV pilus assembly protein n=1 Tax=Qipengyuania sp. JC766 TaxID=3232139 RepID=UPI00345AE635
MRLMYDHRGNVFPLAAVGLITLAAMVGGGVDMSRAYMAQNRLQNACDAGVLAGRKAVANRGFNAAAQTQANNFFAANFDAQQQDVDNLVFTPSSPDNGNTVEGTATATIDAAVMQLFGFDDIDLAANCSATMSIGNSDVVMVLDTTGSMACTSAMSSSECSNYIAYNGYDEDNHGSDSRLKELKDAMKSFYSTVNTAAMGGNGRVRYGFVPYSSSVNVGRLLDPSHVVDSWEYPSREAQFITETQQNQVGWIDPPTVTNATEYDNYWYGNVEYYGGGTFRRERDCTDGLPANGNWSNYGSAGSPSTNTYVNYAGQQVRETTTTTRESRRAYGCIYSSYYREYYRAYQDQRRDRNEVRRETRNPRYETTTTRRFDKWIYKNVTYDTSRFKTFASVTTPTDTNGTDQTSVWEGCIMERSTVSEPNFSYNTSTGWSPTGAKDLDIDLVPSAGDNTTKWRPLWQQISYRRTTSNGSTGTTANQSDYGRHGSNDYYCPQRSKLLSTMSQSEFNSYADGLFPSGGTYHDIGMIWGARMNSVDGVFASNVTDEPANNGSVSRHIIFMTDGDMAPNRYILGAWGYEFHEQNISDDRGGDIDELTRRHNRRFRAVCDAAKAKGIRVWVIAFASNLSSDLQYCSSDNSSYTAANSSQLNQAFQEIGNVVGELRVVQ